MMLEMKFDLDQPAGLRDIHVWQCGRTDGRRLESHTMSSPGAFGLGELKKKEQFTSSFEYTFENIMENGAFAPKEQMLHFP